MTAPVRAAPRGVVATVEIGGRRWVLLDEVALVVAWCCAHEEELRQHPQWQLSFDRGPAAGQKIKAKLHKFYPGMG